MKLKTILLLMCICSILIVTSGCTTTCIPVTVDQKYHSDKPSDYQIVIINGTAFKVDSLVYDRIETGKLIRVTFITTASMNMYINGVCE
jgi:hypothetical protein